MSEVRVKPRRHLRHEIYSLLAVLALPAVFVTVFPFEAVGFRAAGARGRVVDAPASCAFVRLSAQEEHQALVASRSSWRVGTAEVRGMRAELAGSKLPDNTLSAVEPRRRPRTVRTAVVPYGAKLLPPTLAAPPPAPIEPERAAKERAFPRSELLKIN